MENVEGVIGAVGIDIQFRLLESFFVTGPVTEDGGGDDIALFISGHHRTLSDKERKLAEIVKEQILYDIVVELSTICDGIGGNSSLGDSQVSVILLFWDFRNKVRFDVT